MARKKERKDRVTLKLAREADAARLLSAMREIAGQHRWLLTEPDELPKTLKGERLFIRQHARSPNSILLVVWAGDEIVGVSGVFGGSKRRNRHCGEFGIALREDWTGKGIGTELVRRVLAWARRSGVRRLHLEVFVPNRRAYGLYRKMGFQKEGVRRKSIRIGRRYYDTIEMARLL